MRDLERRLFAPLAGLVLLTVAILVVVMFLIAARVDLGAQQHDEDLVRRGMVAKIRDVERSIAPQVVWDEAVSRLDNQFDPAWARDNIAAYLRGQSGFDQIFLVDHNDRAVLGQIGDRDAPAAYFQQHAQVFGPLVAKLREREAAAPRALGPRADGGLVSRPLQVSSMENLDGEIYLVTASLVRPDFGKSLPRRAQAPIVITALQLDATFLNGFASSFLLAGVHLHYEDARDETGSAHMPLRNLSGNVIATFDWSPSHPGRALLRKAIAPILLVVGALAGAAMLFAHRSRKIAEGLIASEARAKHMALHDALTGLANRILFEERLRQAIDGLNRHRGSMAVLGIDLDRFKAVNDTHGHGAGDELIRIMAHRLLSICRAHETVARLGGDEFAIVVSDIDPIGAAALAERLVKALSDPVDLACGQVFVGGSVGVAMIDAVEAHISSEEAARRADVAMYRAKEQGRGCYCFFETEMDSALKTRRSLEADLRRALADGGVHLAYQPQVDATGRMIGVEALARWTHPTRGAISPAAFVPLAEDCGLIDELGQLVMRRAFEDSLRWRGVKVAVNVSALQIKQAGFPDLVATLLAQTGADPRQMELEITEGALLGDDETTHHVVDRLRAMGFSLALDDFGTGYSSLSYLRRYPIDKIKIDRSFITPLGETREASAVVAAIVRLAKALHLSVIAEGVETNIQREQLRDVGCTQAQGFLFSAAIPAEAIDAMMAAGGRVSPTQALPQASMPARSRV